MFQRRHLFAVFGRRLGVAGDFEVFVNAHFDADVAACYIVDIRARRYLVTYLFQFFQFVLRH